MLFRSVNKGGTNITSYAVGDTLYASGTTTLTKLTGNTTTTKNFLSQTGTGSASQAPSWSTVSKSDVGLSNVENTALSTWAGSTNITTLGTVTSMKTNIGTPLEGTVLTCTSSDGTFAWQDNSGAILSLFNMGVI